MWLVSCSTGPPENEDANRETARAGKNEGGAVRAGGSGSTDETTAVVRRQESRASLVPVAHLSSLRDSVSRRELSEADELSVPAGSLAAAKDLLDRPGFRSFESADAVVDHVGRTPGALGLVPWDEVGPRVKALEIGRAHV